MTTASHVNDGTLSILEQVDILFKRDKSKVSVDVTRPFHQETLNVRPAILFEQIWSDSIPTTVPTDLLALTESSFDDAPSPSVMKGSTTGFGSLLAQNDNEDSIVRRFIKVQLIHVPGANDLAYYLPDVFEDVVPFNHDPNGTYQVRLYKQDTEAEIPFGETGGEWIINHEMATITFFELANVTGVDKDNPPLVSFYKYTGSKGAVTGTGTSTGKEFNGGDGTCGDGARAICVDNKRGNLGSILGEGDCSYAIQFGPDGGCGSWRIIIKGNGDGTTSFHIQYRTSSINSWVTKFHIDPATCVDDCNE
jgi:hypothetical protein